jgi:hypothetical protein
MYKKMLTPLLITILAACNNSGNETSTTTDTADKKMSQQDTSHSMNMTTNVPELPAVPEGAKVYFKNLKNNESVSSPVKVKMGVDKMKVDTTGPVVAASGHYHIFIDAEDSLASGVIVPKDSTHLHYGKAQTEADVPLTPGKHKLTLQFADGLHRSYGSKLATTITVNVKK